MKRTLLCITLSLLVGASVAAQDTDWTTTVPDPETPQGDDLAVPEGWQWRLDRPNPDADVVSSDERTDPDIRFVNMTPGWHITTGPAVIFYHPALSAEGTYRAEAEYHLFPPGDRNEAFGIFVGGTNLDADDQRYLYFLIRKTGEYLVKTRHGSETEVVRDWTAHPAIVPHTSETEESVTNVLAIEAGDDTIEFSVNGETVTSVPRADLPVDGRVGLRVNHRLNVHVSDLRVTPLD